MTSAISNPGQRRFDRWASTYDRSILQRLFFEPVHEEVLRAFRTAGSTPRDVLDIGCGTGRLLETAAGQFDRVHFTGIDASEEMITEARRKHEGDARYIFERGDASALPVGSESFDAVFSTMSFHHWRHQDAGIGEVARVLRPGGVFVLADIDAPFLNLLRPLLARGDHARLRGPDEIQHMLERSGLDVVERRRFLPLGRTQILVARKPVSGSRA